METVYLQLLSVWTVKLQCMETVYLQLLSVWTVKLSVQCMETVYLQLLSVWTVKLSVQCMETVYLQLLSVWTVKLSVQCMETDLQLLSVWTVKLSVQFGPWETLGNLLRHSVTQKQTCTRTLTVAWLDCCCVLVATITSMHTGQVPAWCTTPTINRCDVWI